eukprot:182108-Pyramimonas_sp.AAC.1
MIHVAVCVSPRGLCRRSCRRCPARGPRASRAEDLASEGTLTSPELALNGPELALNGPDLALNGPDLALGGS